MRLNAGIFAKTAGGPPVALRPAMDDRLADTHFPDAMAPIDGFGTRRIDQDPRHGRVEVLSLVPKLATVAAEQAIRARAAKLIDPGTAPLALVHRIDRTEDSLSVMSAIPEGTRLSTLLSHLRSGAVALSGAASLELAHAVVRAVASLHDLPGTPAHGALNPAHVVVAADGSALLTDAAFGAALEGLQHNREQLWREFLLALPATASLPRFDPRADVTQLGATVLAVLLQRPLTASEYPKRVTDVIGEAAEHLPVSASSVRIWLQQALQLHPRASFGDGAEAAAGFTHVMVTAPGRRTAVQELQFVLRQLRANPRPPQSRGPRQAPYPMLGATAVATPRFAVAR